MVFQELEFLPSAAAPVRAAWSSRVYSQYDL